MKNYGNSFVQGKIEDLAAVESIWVKADEFYPSGKWGGGVLFSMNEAF